MEDRTKGVNKTNIDEEQIQQLEPVELSEADMLAIAGGRMGNGETSQKTVEITKCCW